MIHYGSEGGKASFSSVLFCVPHPYLKDSWNTSQPWQVAPLQPVWELCMVEMFREERLHSILRVENSHCFVSWLKMSSFSWKCNLGVRAALLLAGREISQESNNTIISVTTSVSFQMPNPKLRSQPLITVRTSILQPKLHVRFFSLQRRKKHFQKQGLPANRETNDFPFSSSVALTF